MAPRTIEVSRDELVARREHVLAQLGVSLDEFRRRVLRGSLTGDEWDAVSELEEISFLLDDSADDF